MPRVTTPGRQHLDRNGNPLDGGLLYTRETDGTTDKATYPTEADQTASTNALANPIVLDDEGREPEIWGSGDYWMDLKDKNSVQIPTWPKSVVGVDAVINTPDLFYGLGLSNGTDADHDINIALGATMDSTGVTRIDLLSAITKQIDATWAAGTNAGGLASGASLAADTWYHVFVVVVGGVSDVVVDTSVTCANGVANNAVTSYQYINSVLTNGGSNILAFINRKDEMWFDVPITSNGGSTSFITTAQTATMDTPLGVEVMVEAAVSVVQGAAGLGYVLVYSPSQTDTTPTAALSDFDNATSQSMALNKKVLTNTSSQIKYIFSLGTNGSIWISTIGWTILR